MLVKKIFIRIAAIIEIAIGFFGILASVILAIMKAGLEPLIALSFISLVAFVCGIALWRLNIRAAACSFSLSIVLAISFLIKFASNLNRMLTSHEYLNAETLFFKFIWLAFAILFLVVATGSLLLLRQSFQNAKTKPAEKTSPIID